MRSLTLAPILLPAVLAAQNYVSPARYATAEATSGNSYPWFSTHRYQEIHGELRGRPMPIRFLAWRRDGNRSDPLQVARTLDMQLVLAPSDNAVATGTFAGNYAQAPVVAVARRNVSLPDWTQNVGAPAPFDHVVPLDQIYVHNGQLDLLWEVVIHSSTSNQANYFADAFSGSDQSQGTARDVGTGCVIQGNPRPFRAPGSFIATLSTLTLQLSWSAGIANPNQPSALLLGSSNPDLVVPGLCTRLYVNPMLTFNATAGPNGELSFGPFTVPFQPQYVGVRLYSQAASLDPLQAGIPVAMSSGSEGTIPDLPVSSPATRIFAYANPNATTGSLVRAQCLVTQFGF